MSAVLVKQETVAPDMTLPEALAARGYRVLGYQPRDVEVVRFDPRRHARIWDEFVASSANGNLFHTRRFLRYHPPDRFVDHSLLFFREGRPVAMAAGEEDGGHWTAHRFSSHGGLVVVPGLGADRCLDVVWSLLRYAAGQGWTSLQMRFAPDVLFDEDIAPLLWALEIFGFQSSGKELGWCFMPGVADERELEERYFNGARGAIRQARDAKLVVRRSDDFAAFWSMLETNLDKRFQVAPTHSLEEIQRLRGLCPGEIELWAVFHASGRMVAGSVVFELSSTTAHTFYSAQDYEFKALRPSALLMHHLCMEFLLRRRKRLNLGVITAHGATELNVGLSFFKQSFGPRPTLRRTYRLLLPGR